MKPLLILALTALLAIAPQSFAQPADSQRIDELIEADYKKHKITPNPPASDEVFLRRVYLDIIGRIPTKAEADSFLNAEVASKRSKLIDHLLDSDGRVSHDFNYWADLLRIKSRMQGESGGAYSQWVKDSLAKNQRYDDFVKEMVTADGFIWDNGAVGYYLRDAGMPLDNMSNTAQVFLGTQLVCAQCHNHPFDKWQQKDYYAMAAFTFGVETRVNPEQQLGISKIIDRNKKRKRAEQMSQSTRRALREILEPLSYGATESTREVKLPTDYQYDDAAPGSVVTAAPIFGEKIRLRGKESPRDGYAEWLTDTQNPRFTRVIANRLWKRAFGMGLIEPVDDLRDDTEASNPALMRYLEQQMRNKGYDMKRFMSMIYNTRTYQRAATTVEVPSDQPYYFPGPLLRRMSAEQMWDSIITLTIPAPDERKGVASYSGRQLRAKENADRLKERADKNPRDILEQAEKIGEAMDLFEAESKKIRFEILVAQEDDDQKLVRELRAKQKTAEKKRDESIRKINVAADQFGVDAMSMNDNSMTGKKGKRNNKGDEPSDKWSAFNRDLVRASELPSPAPNGHFLREFGQSDRETIDNSNSDTSVAQALGLLNGTITDDVLSKNSIIMSSLETASTPEAKREVLFLSILGRQPRPEEAKTFAEYAKTKGDKAYPNLVWALLNTSEFAFVQ